MDKNTSDYRNFKINQQLFAVALYAFMTLLTFALGGIRGAIAFTSITCISYGVSMFYYRRKING